MSSFSKSFISHLQEDLKERFGRDRSLMSFSEYLDEVAAQPQNQTRDTARYLYDAIQSFGYQDLQKPYGMLRRYNIFDAPFDHGVDAVSGQEEVQGKLVGLLGDFIREGRSNRLILLNGPNGSAKTSIINCLQRGLEVYSASENGALYTFSWLFPNKQSEGGGIGFGQSKGHSNVKSYSELTGAAIDARVANELRDHPLLILPKLARLEFLRSAFKAEVTSVNELEADDEQIQKEIEDRMAALPRYITDGSLSPQSAAIFEALLKSYQGDITEVLKHVQVERFTISRKYRRGATTVDPQLRVDAQARQVTADRSLSSLPSSLQHLNLFEPMGHLVEGNRGVIEYNDLLKRPVEAFKYLLSTTESGAVRLDHLTIFIDAVMIGSCNFETLQAFIEMPDFASFKGRIELVRVPYLRDINLEEAVYASTINSLKKRVFVTPDVSHWLAKWAVMTRLERPQPVHFSSDMRTIIESMTPHDKLELYALGRANETLTLEQRKSLQREIVTLYHEPYVGGIYEGWLGASPRELKGLLLSLGRPGDDQKSVVNQTVEAQLENGVHFISPLRLFGALQGLCKEDSVYPFLRRKVSGHFYQPKIYVDELKDIYLNRLKIEFFNAFGLIAPDNEFNQLSEYIHQLRYKLRGEKIHNPHTGQYEEPNEQLLREVEKRLGIKSNVDRARDSIIQQIAKWKIENPEAELDYREIFEEELRSLRLSYLTETEEMATERHGELMIYLSGEGKLDETAQQKADKALKYLKDTLGYHEESLLEVLHSLDFTNS